MEEEDEEAPVIRFKVFFSPSLSLIEEMVNNWLQKEKVSNVLHVTCSRIKDLEGDALVELGVWYVSASD
jgi:hypothetical protein